MPPRKRKRSSDPASVSASASASSPHPETTPNANTTVSSLSPDDIDDAPPFLNTTFSTHRLSPLHLGPHPLTQTRLHTLSQRLRDLLVGDVVRGIELGLDRADAADPAMRRAGALEVVSLGWVRLESLLGRYVSADGGGGDDPDTSASTVGDGVGSGGDGGGGGAGSLGKRRALQIELQYENTECVALLLPAVGPSSSLDEIERQDAAFLYLPLLLLRMPAPLRPVICGFLSRTFDCRISTLGLGTRSLVGALEGWLGESGLRAGLAKDVVVTLGFYGPAVTANRQATEAEAANADPPTGQDGGEGTTKTMADPPVGIKAIDIIIPYAELRRFVRAGRTYEAAAHNRERDDDEEEDLYDARKRRHLAGDKDEEGWTWRQQQQQPFIEALAHYVRAHLALDLFHPAVRVTKIACGGFVLSEGKVKIFGVPPSREGDDASGLSDRGQRAVWAVFEGLGERARVRGPERDLKVVAGAWDG